jgi:zinc protease
MVFKNSEESQMRRNHATSLLTLVLAAAFVISAVTAGPAFCDKKRPHEKMTFPELRELTIPEVQQATLANGLKLYYLQDSGLPLVNARMIVRTGGFLDPADKVGLAGITGSVMRTGGTATIPGDDLDELLEGIAARVEIGIGDESGFATLNCLTENFEQVLEIYADVIRNPALPQEKIDLAMIEARSGISRRNDNPNGILGRELSRAIYGPDGVYARNMEYEHLANITRDDMAAFHAAWFHPENCILAVWGDIDPETITAQVEKVFEGWDAGAPEFPAYPEIPEVKASVNLIEKTDLNQSYIALGHLGTTRNNPDYFALQVMNEIFGTSGFTSRLMRAVRTAEGLTYGVSGGIYANYGYPAEARMSTFTSLENTGYTIDLLKSELAKLIADGVTQAEVDQARQGILNSFVFNFDSKGEVINRLLTYDYYGYPADFLMKYKTSIEGVTVADVNRVARENWHPDNMVLIVVGDPAKFDKPLSGYGKVQVVDITIPDPPSSEVIPEATAESLATGTELMKAAMQAHGGDKLLAAKNIFSKSDITVSTPQGEMGIAVESWTVFPDKSWTKMILPFGAMVRVFNGTEGWQEMAGQKQPAPAEDFTKEFARDMDHVLRGIDGGEYTFQYVDDVEFEGTAAHRVVIRDRFDRPTTVFISVENFRVVGRRYVGETMSGPGELTEVVLEWADFDGIPSATQAVVRLEGEDYMSIATSERVLDGEVDMAIFEKEE